MSSEQQAALSAWRRFLDGDEPTGDVREPIAASWRRSRAAHIDAYSEALDTVPHDDLQGRRDRHRELLAVLEPHLHNASSVMGSMDHCWLVFDAEGVVLATTGSPVTSADDAALRPRAGTRLSEASVGTHAAPLSLRTGRPATVVCNEHYRSAWHDTVSLAAPISLAGQGVIGGVALQSHAAEAGPHCLVLVSQMAFAAERELMETRAHAVTSAEARAERDSRQRIARLQQVTSEMADSVDEDELAEICCRASLYVRGARLAALYLDTPEGQRRQAGVAAHDPALLEEVSSGTRPPQAREGNRVSEVPLHVGQRTLGTLVVETELEAHNGRRYETADQLYLRALADQAAASVERARLHAAAERARAEAEAAVERMSFLGLASETLASTLDYDQALARIAELAVTRLADWCAVEVLDGDTCTQLAVAHKDPDKVALALDLRRRYPPRRNMPGGVYEVISTRRSVLYERIEPELIEASAHDEEHKRLTRELGLRSALIVPMVARDRALGAITLVNSNPDRPLGRDDLAMSEVLAQRAAIALDNARLFEDARRRARQQEVIAEFGHHAIEAPPETLWDEAARVVTDVLQVNAASVVEHRADRLRVVATRGLPQRLMGADLAPDAGTLVGHTLSQGALVVVDDIDQETRFDVSLLADHELRSAMAVPIPGSSSPYGVVAAFSDTHRAFGPAEAHFLTSIANVLGAALQQGIYHQELEAASRHKDEFLAMLAHELRNPLAAIQGAAALLTRGAERELLAREQRALSIIDRQIGHMVHLVDDLLDVSRVMRGKIELQIAAVDLVALGREVCSDHAESARARNIVLRFVRTDTSETRVRVPGDRVRLVQVVGNLVNNAIKFTPSGGHVTIEVDGSAERDEARISVVDDGAGIDAEALATIFEPFSQADRSLDRSAGGLGLGLSVVNGLVELHGGRVEAFSGGPGQGARFDVYLPGRIEGPSSAPKATRATPSAEVGAGLVKVLVVEDNLDAAEVLAELLELLGHRVALAHDVPQALDALSRERPDVILCDIGLPGEMSGYDLARKLRADQAWDSTWLIALTGYGSADDRQRALSAGFDEHLTKPVEVAVIESMLAEYAGRPRTG